jgi:hypothetical protein
MALLRLSRSIRTLWPIRSFTLVLLLIIVAACKRDGELSDTLAWMDNTYNRHDGASGALGHGRMDWYDSSLNGQADEYLVFGSTETFTHDGCQMGLRIQDNPYATASRDVWHTSVRTFNLRDINPQSIKVSKYSHRGGLRCDDYNPEEQRRYSMNCDHAVVAFSTHSEAPLIDEESHTTFAKLQGSDHESKGNSKGAGAFFEVDDVEYAGRFAKAFRHAVELCGGKPEAF